MGQECVLNHDPGACILCLDWRGDHTREDYIAKGVNEPCMEVPDDQVAEVNTEYVHDVKVPEGGNLETLNGNYVYNCPLVPIQRMAIGVPPWDELLHGELVSQLRPALYNLVQVGDVFYPRSVKPEGAAGLLELCGWWDGGTSASIYCVYELVPSLRMDTWLADRVTVVQEPSDDWKF